MLQEPPAIMLHGRLPGWRAMSVRRVGGKPSARRKAPGGRGTSNLGGGEGGRRYNVRTGWRRRFLMRLDRLRRPVSIGGALALSLTKIGRASCRERG